MPIFENSNTVTVGKICLNCGLFQEEQCPYGNHLKSDSSKFVGDVRGKCILFQTGKTNYAENTEEWYKLAESIVSCKKRAKLNPQTKVKMFNYWKIVYPEDYVSDMVDDVVKTGPKRKTLKFRKKNK